MLPARAIAGRRSRSTARTPSDAPRHSPRSGCPRRPRSFLAVAPGPRGTSSVSSELRAQGVELAIRLHSNRSPPRPYCCRQPWTRSMRSLHRRPRAARRPTTRSSLTLPPARAAHVVQRAGAEQAGAGEIQRVPRGCAHEAQQPAGRQANRSLAARRWWCTSATRSGRSLASSPSSGASGWVSSPLAVRTMQASSPMSFAATSRAPSNVPSA